MEAIILLLSICIVVFLVIKLKKKNTNEIKTIEKIETKKQKSIWFALYREDNQKVYYVGPFEDYIYQTGDKVEGATGVYYRVISSTIIEPKSTITGITKIKN